LSEELYAEKLAYFKENEKPEVALLIGDDADLIKLIIAWANTTVTRADEFFPLQGNSDSEVWQWLWRHTRYSREDFLAKSALFEYTFDKKIIPLIGNRIVYPDGTIHSFVQRYLRDRVLRLFDAKSKRHVKKVE
jgi:hypothetical protein